MPKTKLRISSEWRPPYSTLEADRRLSTFSRSVRALFSSKRAVKQNLSSFHRTLLDTIRSDDSIVYTNADKGLGLAGVELQKYIGWGLKHLTDTTTYRIIPEAEAWADIHTLRDDILRWTFRHRKSLSPEATKFLRKKLDENMKEPFGYFYLMPKLHKTPMSTRPVCSDMASLVHPLGQWVTEFLQPIVQTQHTYFKDSFALKRELDTLSVPPNASLFTYDAISMYTKIDTDDCIARLNSWFNETNQLCSWFTEVSPAALMEAISIVMKNNRMKFGDLYVLQIVGIAMGMSPAPTLANLYIAIYEAKEILDQFLGSKIMFLRRFIDDGLGIWLHHPNPHIDRANWLDFQRVINASGLKWTFSSRSQSAVFMDMTIEIVEGKLVTSLYHKPLALHSYIPPHSCHSPGVLTGLVFGSVLRIFRLCSRESDIDRELFNFMDWLLARGYHAKAMLPLFQKAIENARRYLSRSPLEHQQLKWQKEDSAQRQVYLHVPFHPQNPPSNVLQRIWRREVFCPPGKPRLNSLKTVDGHRIPVDRLVICYHRAPNIGNLLSYRRIDKRSGPKVSSFLA